MEGHPGDRRTVRLVPRNYAPCPPLLPSTNEPDKDELLLNRPDFRPPVGGYDFGVVDTRQFNAAPAAPAKKAEEDDSAVRGKTRQRGWKTKAIYG